MLPILADTEARARVALGGTEGVGGRNYWRHATSEMLCLHWYDTKYREFGHWAPGYSSPPDFSGRVVACHNMFDFDRFGFLKYGIKCKELRDSSFWAKKMGLSARLDHSATALTNVRKDKESSNFTKKLSSVRRPTGKGDQEAIPPNVWGLLTPEEQKLLGEQPPYDESARRKVNGYCHSDVEVMRQAWPRWRDWVDSDHDVEVQTIVMNDRGVYFDRDLAAALLENIEHNMSVEVRKAARQLGLQPDEVRKIVQSPKKLAQVLGLPNAQKGTLEKCTHPLASVRRELKSVIRGKLQAGERRCDHDTGLLHDMLIYYGAAPGRWTSEGYQAHNMVRPHKMFEDWSNAQIHELACKVTDRKHIANKQEIDLMLRACIRARPGNLLVVRDFKAIEAVALAWSSGDRKALEVFRAGADNYKPAAAMVFGVSVEQVTKDMRAFGKRLELACQYGQGPDTFEEKCIEEGVDLDAVGVSAKEAVEAWRELHAPIVKFWKLFETAFKAALDGHASKVGPFDIVPSDSGKDIGIFTPFGRPVVYRNARIVTAKSKDRKLVNGTIRKGQVRQVLAYDGRIGHPKQYDIRGDPFDGVYGGLLTQNSMESICRDLMARVLIEAEKRGLNPVLTVHDEAVCDVHRRAAKEAEKELHEITTTVPSEVRGMPIGANGFVGERYQK